MLHFGSLILYTPLRFYRLLFNKEKRNLIVNRSSVLRTIGDALAASRASLPIPSRFLLLILPSRAKIFCPWKDGSIVNEVWKSNVYEKLSSVKKDFVVIDAGAHVGIFTIKASREAGNKGTIIACEPHPTTYALLVTNVKNNKCENVMPLNIALSNCKVKAKLYLSDRLSENSMVPISNKWILINVDTLDNIVKKNGLKRVDFMKIDVEGAELQVLKGAEKTLEKFRPFLSIAAYHWPGEVEEIQKFLASKSYAISTTGSFIYAR